MRTAYQWFKRLSVHSQAGITAGLLGGTALVLMTQYLEPMMPKTPGRRRSLFFGDITDWPGWILHYTPADYAVLYVGFGTVMWIFSSRIGPRRNDGSLRSLIGEGASMCAAGGLMLGVCLAMPYGWYAFIEGTIVGTALFLAISTVICMLLALVFGTGYGVYRLFTRRHNDDQEAPTL